MNIEITSFETRYLDQLDRLPPENWQSSTYDLFMHNEWQPWFHSFQVVVEKQNLIGFGMIFHFDDVAWLGWILVHHNYRKQGIGTQMSQFLVEKSKSLGATKILLTATELGAPIYEKLGFKYSGNYLFFSLPQNLKNFYESSKIRKAKKTDINDIVQLDQMATAEKRQILLENYIDSTFVFGNPSIEGFYIENLGSGWIVANNADAGAQLAAYRNKKQHKLVIVPDGNIAYVKDLREVGYVEKFKVPRMVLGSEPNWKPDMIYNRGAGYCG